jgi:hypothetical protein
MMTQQSGWIYISFDLGEAATNRGGLAKAVDDTQGRELGETGRSASRVCDCFLRVLECCLQLYRYIL